MLSAQTPAGLRALPDPLYGVTLDDVSDLPEIVASIQALPRRTTARIVFDENTKPTDYTKAVNTLQPVAYLMGEILDSEYVKPMGVSAYSSRAAQFLGAFGNQVDLWEVGNEVNGEWLGNASDVVAKISGAYGVVSQAGKRTALTLYYNPSCWSNKANEMLPWAEKNIPAAMKNGLNYVLVSYYEGDCNNYRPSASEWTSVFEQLHTMFPNAKLGFGEVGLANPVRSGTMAKAESVLNYYYGLKINVPGYIGGGFWWYGAEDLVPQTKKLWPVFATRCRTRRTRPGSLCVDPMAEPETSHPISEVLRLLISLTRSNRARKVRNGITTSLPLPQWLKTLSVPRQIIVDCGRYQQR